MIHMEPTILMWSTGDKNPLAYYRQVPGVKRLVVYFDTVPGQVVERARLDHVLELLGEVGLGLAVVETFVISNAIKLELAECDQHIEAFLETYHEDDKGAVPIPSLLKLLYDKGCTAPFRADHAPGMYGHDLNFGYGLVARAPGLSFLQGVLKGLSAA